MWDKIAKNQFYWQLESHAPEQKKNKMADVVVEVTETQIQVQVQIL